MTKSKKMLAAISVSIMSALLMLSGCSGILDSTAAAENESESRTLYNYDQSLSGIYYIRNAFSGLYLDVNGGSSENGTNIQQYQYNGSAAQQFNIVPAGNGYYAIKTVSSGSKKALDVWSKGTADGTNIAIYTYNGGTNQLFKFVRQNDGSYAILSKITDDRSGLDDYGWSTQNGGNVCQWGYWGGACQHWILTKVSSSAGTPSNSGSQNPGNSSGSSGFNTSSKTFAKNLKAGWNLGNTLDAFTDDPSYTAGLGLNSETCWSQPKTTREMLRGIRSAGFTTIRIPVTWHNHITGPDNRIDPQWMARVRTVVDWAMGENLYVIINIHHDNISPADSARGIRGYVINSAYANTSKSYISAVWKQIASEFKNYNDHLIFELLNEPRNVGGSDEWWVGDFNAARNYNSIITSYEQTAIEAIRTTGGNNSKRYLMVPAYGGSFSNLNSYTLPEDGAGDKLIISYHAYSPYNFAMYSSGTFDTSFDQQDRNELDSIFSTARKLFPNTGIVIGETSASNKGNLASREAWTEYFFGKAYSSYDCSVIIWDNGAYSANPTSGEQHGYFNRTAGTWYFPSIISRAIRAAGSIPGSLKQSN